MIRWRGNEGFTLVEMIVTVAVLSVLTFCALPLVKTAVKRDKEIEFRSDLRLIREAIDAYKALAAAKRIDVSEDSEGYPPDLATLVKGVMARAESSPSSTGTAGATATAARNLSAPTKLVRFLRRIPKDPMTNSTDWALRSYQDDLDSDTWGGENVYDVHTRSQAIALDGTRYKDW